MGQLVVADGKVFGDGDLFVDLEAELGREDGEVAFDGEWCGLCGR